MTSLAEVYEEIMNSTDEDQNMFLILSNSGDVIAKLDSKVLFMRGGSGSEESEEEEEEEEEEDE